MSVISHTAVHLALRNRLLTVSGLPARANENKDYTPVAGTAYVREKLAPATQQGVGISTDSPSEYTGLYVVTYFGVEDTGLAVSTSADAILAVFTKGLTLTATDGSVVRVRSDVAPWRGEVITNDGWAACTISIPYRILTS